MAAAAAVHRIATHVVVPEDGAPPYWTTACGKRLSASALAITSNKKDVTCDRCGTLRGSKR